MISPGAAHLQGQSLGDADLLSQIDQVPRKQCAAVAELYLRTQDGPQAATCRQACTQQGPNHAG